MTGSRNSIRSSLVGKPFLFEELPELRHVVGADAEDAQCLQDTDVLGPFDIFGQLVLPLRLRLMP